MLITVNVSLKREQLLLFVFALLPEPKKTNNSNCLLFKLEVTAVCL